jgi:ribosomal protein S27E
LSRQPLYSSNSASGDKHLNYNNKKTRFRFDLLDAKCPKCDNKAQVNEEMTAVKCENCGYLDNYENYINTMKSKAENMADNFQFKENG